MEKRKVGLVSVLTRPFAKRRPRARGLAPLPTPLLIAAIAVAIQFDTPHLMAANIYVDDCGPTCSGSGTALDPYCCIATAIAAAADGDRVVLLSGTYTGPDNKNLSWTGKNLTILGRNGASVTIIDLENSGRAFSLSGAGITLATKFQELTIVRGSVSSPEDGGAIGLLNGASAAIQNCVFRGNSARDGGAVSIKSAEFFPAGTLNVRGSVFGGNTASDFGGAIVAVDATVSLQSCRLADNTANFRGGGLFFETDFGVLDSLTIVDTVIQGNDAGVKGGGIYILPLLQTIAPSTIDRTTVLENTVGVGTCAGPVAGGGIAVDTAFCEADGVSSLTITNSIIAKNTVLAPPSSGTAKGGGLYVFICPLPARQFEVIVCNTTIAENDVISSASSTNDKGGGIYALTPKTLEVLNTILWDNTAPDGGNQIAVSFATLDISWTDVGGTGGVCPLEDTTNILLEDGATETCGSGNADVNPSFVNPALDDFHIAADSDVIDLGDETGCGVFDIDLEPRLDDLFVDMGADEIQTP